MLLRLSKLSPLHVRHICAGPLKPLTGVGTSPGSSWDPLSSVHGKPVGESTVDADEVATDVAPQSSHSSRSVGSGCTSAKSFTEGPTRMQLKVVGWAVEGGGLGGTTEQM